MSKLFSNTFLSFLLIVSPGLILWSSLLGRLYPIHLSAQTPFFFDLIEFHKTLPPWSIYLFGVANFLLIFLLAKAFFAKRQAYIPLLLFSISPWPAYLSLAGSYYIYLLTLLMLSLYGVWFFTLGKKKLGMAILVLSSTLLLYSSLLILIIFPILILASYLTKALPFKAINKSVILIMLLCLPLFIFMIKNPVGLKNIFVSQVGIFSDPGLIGNVNKFQGESRKAGLFFLAKPIENKYTYLTQYSILKALKHLHPSTFFTSQEGLLKFSFSPPIFLGFLISFLYGLFFIIKQKSYRKYLIFPLILLLPSFFSKIPVDLNRLVLTSPFIIFIISFGILQLSKNRSKIHKLILILCIIFVFAQFLVTLFDINLREYLRFERTFNGSFEIGEQ